MDIVCVRACVCAKSQEQNQNYFEQGSRETNSIIIIEKCYYELAIF